jgi:hypothetical protein
LRSRKRRDESLRRLGGIIALQLKRSGASEIPSKIGFCELCRKEGYVRFFVAAKLPRFMHLCNEHYLKIRGRLERALEHILLEDGLEPKQGDVDEGDNSQF